MIRRAVTLPLATALAVVATLAAPVVAYAEDPAEVPDVASTSTVTPKKLGYHAPADAAGGVGGLPGGSLWQAQKLVDSTSAWAGQLADEGPGVVGGVVDDVATAGSAAVEAQQFTLWEAYLWYEIKNDLNQLMMTDEIKVRFRKSREDGSFSAPHLVYPSQCTTGGGMYPRTVVTASCWWQLGVVGDNTLSFTSGVRFWDQLGGLSFNDVRLEDAVVIYADGSYEHVGGFQSAGGGPLLSSECANAFGAPPTWPRPDCELTVTQVATP